MSGRHDHIPSHQVASFVFVFDHVNWLFVSGTMYALCKNAVL